MEDNIQMFDLSYQKDEVAIYLHEGDYMREKECQCGMSISKMLTMLFGL